MWKKIICWTLVLIWLVVIFSFSAKTGAGSDKQSKYFTTDMVKVMAPLFVKIGLLEDASSKTQVKELAYKMNPFMRKCAHAGVYFVLAILVLLALFTGEKIFGRNMLITIAICFIYSLFDELHQTFIPGRAGMFVDCLIDTLGAIIGCLFYLIPVKIFTKKKD